MVSQANFLSIDFLRFIIFSPVTDSFNNTSNEGLSQNNLFSYKVSKKHCAIPANKVISS